MLISLTTAAAKSGIEWPAWLQAAGGLGALAATAGQWWLAERRRTADFDQRARSLMAAARRDALVVNHVSVDVEAAISHTVWDMNHLGALARSGRYHRAAGRITVIDPTSAPRGAREILQRLISSTEMFDDEFAMILAGRTERASILLECARALAVAQEQLSQLEE